MLTKRNFVRNLALSLPGLWYGQVASGTEPYFASRTIRWIVPYRPGGGYDEYSRIIAPVLEAHTGARIDLVNLPGGGGMRGAGEVFKAPADGLHIGLINGSGLMAQGLARPEKPEWNISRYSFIGRVAAEPRVLTVSAKSTFNGFDALRSAGRTIVAGSTGVGGSTYLDAVVAARILGLDQRVVHGFDNSADIRLALLRGDIDCMWGSLGSAYDGLVNGDFRALLVKTPVPDTIVADIPTIDAIASDRLQAPQMRDLMQAWSALSEIGRPLVGPPGIPGDRLAALRAAFDTAMSDPALREAARIANRGISPLTGAESAELAQRFADISPETRDTLTSAVRGTL